MIMRMTMKMSTLMSIHTGTSTPANTLTGMIIHMSTLMSMTRERFTVIHMSMSPVIHMSMHRVRGILTGIWRISGRLSAPVTSPLQ